MRIAGRTAQHLALVCSVMLAAGARPVLANPERAGEGRAQEQVTLQGLLDEAMRRSPGLQAKKRRYEAARARVIVAWMPDDPEVGVDVEGQRELLDFGARTDNEYMISQTIPFPTTLWARGVIAARETQIAFQQYKEEERNVIWHIEQPYHELFLAQKTLVALEEVRGLVDRLVNVVQARYESNQASQQDLLKTQIESAKIGIELVEWKEKEHLAEAHFSHILNRSLETSYAIAESPRSTSLSLSRAELEQFALTTRPELKALEAGLRRANANRFLTATSWLPDVTGRIEARQFKDEGDIREHDTFIGVTVPVWSLLKGFSGEWKSAQREVEAAKAEYEEMKNEVLLAVHEAYSKAWAADYALHTYEQLILPQAKQQVEVAFAAYEAGRTDLLMLIDAQRTLKDAQRASYQVAADYELGLSNLRFAVGGELASSGQ